MRGKENIKEFISLLANGCINDDELKTLSTIKAHICFNCLIKCIFDNNLYSFDYISVAEEIAKNNSAKNRFYEICILWISTLKIYYKTKKYDEKNQESVMTGNILYEDSSLSLEISDVENFLKDYDQISTIAEYFTREMNFTSNTIKQIFSSMVFYFIEKYSDPNIKLELNEIKEIYNFDNIWYILPILE